MVHLVHQDQMVQTEQVVQMVLQEQVVYLTIMQQLQQQVLH